MWLWIGIAIVAVVVLGWFGWAAVAVGGHADDEMMRRYQREKQAFEDHFE